MRICFVVDLMSSGGAERVASVLCNEFCKTEEVALVMIASETEESFYKLDKRVHIVPLLKDVAVPHTFFKKVKLLKKHLIHSSYDVIISFLPNVNICAYLANKKTKIPHIVSERNNPYNDPHNFIKRKIKEHVFSKVDGVVLQTNDASDYYKKIIETKKTIIPNPLFSFDQKITRKKMCGDNRIVMVGRLEPQKNIQMAIKAFELFANKHKETILEIYGTGSSKHELLEMIGKLGLKGRVLLKGNSSDWISETIDCAMFLNTSLFEGMPNSLLEAVCYGIPCIATDCPIGGSKEIINNMENGLLCRNRDFKELAELMSLLYHNISLITKFINNNSNKHVEFSKETISARWLNFIKDIIG